MPPKKKKKEEKYGFSFSEDLEGNAKSSVYTKLLNDMQKKFQNIRVARGEDEKEIEGELDMIKGCATILEKAVSEMTNKYFKGDQKKFMENCAISTIFCGKELEVGDPSDEAMGMRAGVATIGTSKTIMLLMRHLMEEIPKEMAAKSGDSIEECIVYLIGKMLEGKGKVLAFGGNLSGTTTKGKSQRNEIGDALDAFMRKRDENDSDKAITEKEAHDLKASLKDLSYDDIKKFLE